jgi:RNA polymerase sigma-70 factor (ECF subfamily)
LSSVSERLENTASAAEGSAAASAQSVQLKTAEQVCERYFAFVWRNARRLGVADEAVDDVVQDVLIVVHRRFPEFEWRSSLETWLFGILLRIISKHRRAVKRRSEHEPLDERLGYALAQGDAVCELEHRDAARLLQRLLDSLSDEKRAMVVAVEVEQMTVPEAAEALDIPLTTAQTRLRTGRRELTQAVTRLKAQNRWRQP